MNDQVLTFKRMEQFTDYLFDSKDQARKAALILKAILEARSPRLSDSWGMPGNRKRSSVSSPLPNPRKPYGGSTKRMLPSSCHLGGSH